MVFSMTFYQEQIAVMLSLVMLFFLTLMHMLYVTFYVSNFGYQLKSACHIMRKEVKEDIDGALIGVDPTVNKYLCRITSAIDYIIAQSKTLYDCISKEGDFESAKEDFFRGKMLARVIGVYQSQAKLSEYEESVLKQLKSKYAENSPVDVRAESLLYIKNFFNEVCANVRKNFSRCVDLSTELLILGSMKVALEILEDSMKYVGQDIALEHFCSIMEESTEEKLIEAVTSKGQEFTLRLSQSIMENVAKDRADESDLPDCSVCCVIRAVLGLLDLISMGCR